MKFYLLWPLAADCELGKRLYFVPDNLDTTLVWSIQLQHTVPRDIAEQLPGGRKYGARLTGTGRAVKQQMRKISTG